MVKGMDSLHRIKQLLSELQVEMKNLEQETIDHREELPYLEKQIVDLQHIPENLSMNGSESARFTKRFSNTLHSRRDLKDFFDIFNTLHQDINRVKSCVNDVTPRFIKIMEEQERVYVFRTPEMFDFFQSFKNSDSRTRVSVLAPKGMSPVMKPESILPIHEQSVMKISNTQSEVLDALTETEVISDEKTVNKVEVPFIKAELSSEVKGSFKKDSIKKVYRNGKTWFIEIDAVVVFSSDKVEEIIMYLIDNDIQEFRTGAKAKQFMVSGIAKIKRMKKNTSLYYMEKMNELDVYLKAA